MNGDINISWSSYLASQQETVPSPPALVALLPLFRDNAHSVAMIKHGMNLIQRATNHLNSGQATVMSVDQPLYAIAKKIQWAYPVSHGVDKFVILMGGLRIEMALRAILGQVLEKSGWRTVMDKANVTTEGRAVGIEKGSSTFRGQWAHQVTLAAFSVLKQKA